MHVARPLLGDKMRVALSNYGADIPVFGFGAVAAAALPLCPQCSLGLRIDRPIFTGVGVPLLAVWIPPDSALVGQHFGIQGLRGGSCMSTFSPSDMYEMIVL